MTVLSRIALGSLPVGKQAVDGCLSFKRAVQQLFGRVDSAYLVTVEDAVERKRGIEVVFDPGEAEAVAWAESVRDAARGLWDQVKRGAERSR